jgi:hypothetical protein
MSLGRKLKGRPVHFNVFEVAFALEDLFNVSLIVEDMPISLLSNLCQSSPSLHVCWITLIAMSSFCLLPVSL